MKSTSTLRVAQQEEVPPVELQKSFFEPRSLVNNLLTILAWVMAVMACLPLFSVLIMLIYKGSQRLSWSIFTELPAIPGDRSA